MTTKETFPHSHKIFSGIFQSATVFVREIYNLSNMNRFSTTFVNQSQNVPTHSFYVAILSLIIGTQLSKHIDVDMKKLITMALIHDIPEYRISDIPADAKQVLQLNLRDAEVAVFNQWLKHDEYTIMFIDYTHHQSIESRIVHIADKLEVKLFSQNELWLGNRNFESIMTDIGNLIEKEISGLFRKIQNNNITEDGDGRDV